MRILISNKIYLYDFPETMKTAIKRGLTIPNPMYEQMLRRVKYSGNKKWVRALYGIKRNFKYYEEKDDALIIGRGNENKLIKFLEKYGVTLIIEYDLAQTKNELKLKGEIELRDYQKGIIEEILEHRIGVLKLSTGYGKTIIALKMIEATRLPTLIVVHQSKELDKYVSDLKRFYKYKAGIIQGDKSDIKDITIGSISTLCRRDLTQLKYRFSMLIADECGCMVSPKRIEAIQSFAPQRLYGASGTPELDSGLTDSIFYTFGNIIIDRELPQKLPTVKIVKSNIEIPVDDYADMITGMIESGPRNDLIVKLCKEQVALKRKVLILVKRVAHCKALSCVLKSFGYKTYHIQSKLSVEERKKQYDLLEKLGKGNNNFDIIIGTLSLLGVGANFPALDTLIFGGDLRARVLGRQAVGRILRLMEGKQDPLVIDIVDNLNPILLSQARARKKLYKDNGWDII